MQFFLSVIRVTFYQSWDRVIVLKVTGKSQAFAVKSKVLNFEFQVLNKSLALVYLYLSVQWLSRSVT